MRGFGHPHKAVVMPVSHSLNLGESLGGSKGSAGAAHTGVCVLS